MLQKIQGWLGNFMQFPESRNVCVGGSCLARVNACIPGGSGWPERPSTRPFCAPSRVAGDWQQARAAAQGRNHSDIFVEFISGSFLVAASARIALVSPSLPAVGSRLSVSVSSVGWSLGTSGGVPKQDSLGKETPQVLAPSATSRTTTSHASHETRSTNPPLPKGVGFGVLGFKGFDPVTLTPFLLRWLLIERWVV